MWFEEILAARAQPLVEALLVLLANGQRWRHRRVETLTPVSAVFVRRRISIDFTVPEHLHEGLRLSGSQHGGADQWLVPLGWLARRQLVNFDLRSAADEPLPLLLGQQTAQLTTDLLILAAVQAGLDMRDHDAAARATEIIELAADEQPVGDVAALERRARELGLDEQFASLVAASARGFLLLAVLPQISGRQVVKLSSDEHHREARFTLSPELPGLNEAASIHVELDLPDVLRVTSFELWDAGRDDASPRRRLATGERRELESRERPRPLLAPVAGAQRPYVRAALVVSPSEFLLPAFTLAALAVVIIALGLATHIADHAAGAQGSTAATILLAAFAALSGLVLRVEEHPLVRAILAGPRLALGATALGVIVAAVPISLQLSRAWVLAGWWSALALCVLSVSTLWTAIIGHTEWGRRAT
jgi:hypothetical protein